MNTEAVCHPFHVPVLYPCLVGANWLNVKRRHFATRSIGAVDMWDMFAMVRYGNGIGLLAYESGSIGRKSWDVQNVSCPCRFLPDYVILGRYSLGLSCWVPPCIWFNGRSAARVGLFFFSFFPLIGQREREREIEWAVWIRREEARTCLNLPMFLIMMLGWNWVWSVWNASVWMCAEYFERTI